jgi:hypothetical protein
MPPAWLTDIFAAFMLVVAVISAARLVAVRPWRRGAVVIDTDISHLLIAIAMAGMLTSSLATLGNTAWAAVFGVLTAWFAYRVVRDIRANGARALAGGQCAPHLVHGGAMLYVFLAVTAGSSSSMPGMAGMSGSSGATMQALRYPTLTFVFALILIGYTIWDLDQLNGLRHGLTVAVALPWRPSLAEATAGSGHTGTSAAAFSGPAAGSGAAANSPASPAETGQAPANSAGGNGRSAAAGVVLSSGITVGCRIALGATMALMLLLMI